MNSVQVRPGDDAGFYGRLTPVGDLGELSEPGRFQPAPAGWRMILVDVIDATAAAKRYRDVNTVAVLAIVATINAAGNVDIPYTFAGDGATILIPGLLRVEAEDVLTDVRRRAREDFQLELRIGMFPIFDLYARGKSVVVGRWERKMTSGASFAQALFLGDGFETARDLMEDPETSERYELTRSTGVFQADYTGFSRRWSDVPSPHPENLCLAVQLREAGDPLAGYQALLEKIDSFYGDRVRRNPITVRGLRPVTTDEEMLVEARVAFGSDARFAKQRREFLREIRRQVGAVSMWTALGIRTGAARTRRLFPRADAKMPKMDWGRFKDYLVETTDCQKLDGTLRVVMSGYPVQREHLTTYLQAEYEAGRLYYGLHRSEGAQLSSLVFQPNGRQVHFVDGAGGGFALAAQAMREQMRVG